MYKYSWVIIHINMRFKLDLIIDCNFVKKVHNYIAIRNTMEFFNALVGQDFIVLIAPAGAF